MKAALIQLTSGDDPVANLPITLDYVRQAASEGANLILTPEVTNCLSSSRRHQNKVLTSQDDDITIKAMREESAKLGVWINLGSVGVKTDDPDGRFANRSVMIAPNGDIAATYDKVHMFDVQVSEVETYKESAGYRPGDRMALVDTGDCKIGMTICYDIRFPHLHRALAKAGADIILVPAAFSPVTGAAHWEPLLRARAIETGCFVLAAAQTGTHPCSAGKPRQTHGHSLAVSPWGEVIADAGTETGVTMVDLDLGEVAETRRRVPSLTHDRPIKGLE